MSTQVVPQLCQQAKRIGEHLGVTNFKGSQWMAGKVEGETQHQESGELGGVQGETVESRESVSQRLQSGGHMEYG